MKNKLSILTLVVLLTGAPSFAKIQQQGIKTLSDCTAAGATGATCLPLDSQVWDSTHGQQLSASIASGILAGNVSSSTLVSNLGFTALVSGNALTFRLKQKDGATDPTSGSPVAVSFNTGGGYNQLNITSALTLTVPSGASLGTVNGVTAKLYLYVMNNSGTPELAVSLTAFDNGTPQNSVAIAGGSSATTLYSASARSGIGIRLVGRIQVVEATAGVWASGPIEGSTLPFDTFKPIRNEVRLNTFSSLATGNFARFTTTQLSSGTGIVYTDDGTNGAKFTVQQDGIYCVQSSASVNNGSDVNTVSIVVNGSVVFAVSMNLATGSNNTSMAVPWCGFVASGGFVQTTNSNSPSATSLSYFNIVQVAN